MVLWMSFWPCTLARHSALTTCAWRGDHRCPYSRRGSREVRARSSPGTNVSRAAARTGSPSVRHTAATPHRAASPAASPSLRQPPASPSAERNCGPLPTAIGGLDADHAAPVSDRNGDHPPGSARPAMPHAVSEQLAYQQCSVISARCPGQSTAHTNMRATGARSARPATLTLSRTASPVIRAPTFLAARVPRNNADLRLTRGVIHARLMGARQTETCRQRGPSVAVRAEPTVHNDRLGGMDAVRYMSEAVATSTHGGTP